MALQGLVSTGKVLQIVRGSLSTKFAQTTASLVDVGLSATITPTSATSKILIHTTIWAGGEVDAYPYFCLFRGTTKLTDFEGSASSGNQINTFSSGLFGSLTPMVHRQHCLNRHVLDDPETVAATTYKIQGANPYTAGGTGNVFVNRASNDGNASYVQNPQSEIILMEIAE